MKSKYSIIILLLCTTLCACNRADHSFKTPPTGHIVGTITVTNGDGEGQDYQKTGVESVLTCTDTINKKYNILLKKVCFSSRMPVNIDMTIAGVLIDHNGKMTADSIVPTAGLFGEYPKYTIRNLAGKVIFDAKGNPAAITFDMRCGDYPTNYSGLYEEEEESEK